MIGKIVFNLKRIYVFSFADTEEEVRAEAALIFYHKPKCNIKGKHSFNQFKTSIKTKGKNKFLEDAFDVFPTDN